MIPRYSRKVLSDIWTQENKFKILLQIEVLAAEAMCELGTVPKSAVENIKSKARFNVDRVLEIENTTKHDVIAFLTNVAEYVGEDARFLHMGLTSSDVLDTCLAVQLKMAGEIILKDIGALLECLKRRAIEHKYTACIGRSHGIHAEPTTFGLKLAGFYAEFKRNKERMEAAILDISTCAISGAVGTFANVDPFVEEYVAKNLGLKVECVSTQVIPRDRHAAYFATLGIIASSIERLAVEIRHLQRTEVLEAEEFFSVGQKGSSAMPHKRNPILSENITGIARLIRGYVNPAMENVALWHERDISHSAVERVAAPDATILTDFALFRLSNIVDNLVIYEKNMQANLNKLGGVIYSQRLLLSLVEKGMSREDAYFLVQGLAMDVWAGKTGSLQKAAIENEKILSFIDKETISSLFDIGYHTKNIDIIFERVFSN